MAKICILVALLSQLFYTFVQGQQSPCPQYFTYIIEPGTDETIGFIEIQSPPKTSELHIRVKLKVAAELPSRYVGRLELSRSKEESAQAVQQGRHLSYYIHFPLRYPIPTLSGIWFNGEQYCSGPDVTGSFVTTITLEHTLYLSNMLSQNSQPNSWQNWVRTIPTLRPTRRPNQSGVTLSHGIGNNVFLNTVPGLSIPQYNNNNNNNIFLRPFPTQSYPQYNNNNNNVFIRPQNDNNDNNIFYRIPQNNNNNNNNDNYNIFYRPIPQNNNNNNGNNNVFMWPSVTSTTPSYNENDYYNNNNNNNNNRNDNNNNNNNNRNKNNNNNNNRNNNNNDDNRNKNNNNNNNNNKNNNNNRNKNNNNDNNNNRNQNNNKNNSNDNNNNNNNNYDECGISGRSGSTNLLIANGQKTLPGQWPWLVALFVVRNEYKFQCGGSILTTRHVLTAAHCLKLDLSSNETIHPNVLEVALGRFSLHQFREGGTVNREVASYKIHPDYSHTTSGDSDLAVLILRTPVEYSPFIRPICLWSQSSNLQDIENKIGYVVGWGQDENGNRYTEEPRMAMMPIVSVENCHWSYPGFVSLTSNRTFCAGMRDGSGPCNGDSGSGLVLFDATTGRYQLRGVVSRSFLGNEPLCDLTKFIVFVDVAKYLFWILQQISST